MINTRIYDRAPLKDVRVKEPQVGRVRTPQILMSRTNEGYQKGDILDANTTAILIKNLHSPDIERLQEQIEEARRKLADAVMKDSVGAPGGVASLDGNGNIPTSQLGNVDVDIFMIVNELPTEDIKNNKIYCVKDTESTDENNTYIEYAYINNTWEKVGEFKADPDLSQYARLDKNNTFTKKCSFMGAHDTEIGLHVQGGTNLEYLTVRYGIKNRQPKPNMAYVTTGGVFDLNTKLNVSDYQTDKANLDAAIENANTAISTEQEKRENADTQLRNDFNQYFKDADQYIGYVGQLAISMNDKITPKNELDLTSLDVADLESLRSMVMALATELNTRGLIKIKYT